MATLGHSQIAIRRYLCLLLVFIAHTQTIDANMPLVINTWAFTNATDAAWEVISNADHTAVDAVVAGCTNCEQEQCDGTVGFGGSPDENGETTLDAMVMDGATHDVGSVGCLRRIKNAIGVARAIMDYTGHTLLVGELATNFAIEMGFEETNLTTEASEEKWRSWKERDCQPNSRKNVSPDPTKSCGPYSPVKDSSALRFQSDPRDRRYNPHVDEHHHDTIGMVAIDHSGNVAVGTSTNGANHKVPGRVGDSPIIGAGGYADNEVGAAAATGDGDVLMRFVPAYLVVELMRQGVSPTEACEEALSRVAKHYPDFGGALIAVKTNGEYGAACHKFSSFPFSVRDDTMQETQVVHVECMNSNKHKQHHKQTSALAENEVL